ncbi:hypothetical protein LTR56_001516 [Elasticomyces elasticus]|nr:hypothetical protein LTR56_001516 [Elasticomyces elasticus]KAK3668562.1 hypothetical protein LTR22_000449 [Elasticomyces elasticus]KAK4931914.1 hypothetical protein LTR49_001601 [Elasticomyces elasticus]KAK5768555.1 hypothetical protein LTS12_001343 [Elasticomyces elasticus]
MPALPTVMHRNSIHSISHSTVPPPSYAWAVNSRDAEIDPPEYDAYKNDLPVELQDSDYQRPKFNHRPANQCAWYEKFYDDQGHSILECRAAAGRCCHHGAINRLIARNAGRVYDEGPRGLFSLWAEERATGVRHRVFDGPELRGSSSVPDEGPRTGMSRGPEVSAPKGLIHIWLEERRARLETPEGRHGWGHVWSPAYLPSTIPEADGASDKEEASDSAPLEYNIQEPKEVLDAQPVVLVATGTRSERTQLDVDGSVINKTEYG